MATMSSAELLQAHTELRCHTFAYLKSMALQSVIKLGIPTAIHRCGGAASLSDLHVAVPPSKLPCLARLMKLLVVSGIFREEEPTVYSLTPVSRLLVEDIDGGRTCLSPMVVMATSPFHFDASQRLPEWLGKDDDDAAAAETPCMMAHGTGLFGYLANDLEFGALFNDAMGADSRFVAEIVVRECGEVFAGLTSLVDVGGGDGTTAKAIAKAFPHVRCSVLDLPQVVDTVQVDGMVGFVAGNMMEYVPPADAVLLKFVLHNWSDEDCVTILKRSKEAISTKEPKGKVIIIDTVAGSASKQTFEAQLLLDICMMMLTTGEVRDEEKWHRLFLKAGFSRYKINPILGSRSLIEVFP